MAVLVTCNSIGKSYGARPVFENISIAISDGERLGLIGPNGSGKSTFLQILAGQNQPDSGTRSVRKLARIGYVPQEPAFDPEKTVSEVVAGAFPPETPEEDRPALIGVTLGKAGFADGGVKVAALSGGWRRRLSIARELMRSPDLLLLDEPTNHLDLEGILWLEKLLLSAAFASVVVSHDRYFLENVVNEMAEINRVYPEGMFRVAGPYHTFLEKKEEFLVAQARQEESLANKVRREVEWLRRGPKARTGKSRARIESAEALIGQLADVSARNASASVRIDFAASQRKTRKLVSAEGLAKELGGRRLFENLNFTLSPGVRLGLVGPNGSGKTTLLRIVSGELEPDRGVVERADGLRTVYFDQGREQLDPEMRLRDGLGAQGDSVIYRGRPIHVAGWARRFLFRPEQLDTPVGRFSGGERARILIARLMLQPADLLLLDEPTNDLDIDTLEELEDSLMDFPGAMVLVTHDRYMLDRVSNVVLGLDGQGGAGIFADYSQWEQEFTAARPVRTEKEKPQPKSAPAKKRLSYLDSREWDAMERKILEAEQELEQRRKALEDPEVMADPALLQRCYEEMKAAEEKVAALYERWAELENKIR